MDIYKTSALSASAGILLLGISAVMDSVRVWRSNSEFERVQREFARMADEQLSRGTSPCSECRGKGVAVDDLGINDQLQAIAEEFERESAR